MNDKSLRLLDVASGLASGILSASVAENYSFDKKTIARYAVEFAQALIAEVERVEVASVEREKRRTAFGVESANASGAKLHSTEWHKVLRQAQEVFDQSEAVKAET